MFRAGKDRMGVSDNTKGFILALVSSAFIGSSFILKKKGLKRAGKSGTRAGEITSHSCRSDQLGRSGPPLISVHPAEGVLLGIPCIAFSSLDLRPGTLS